MDANSTQYQCVALFSSRLGFESVESQKAALQDYAKKNNLKIVVFTDSENFKGLSISELRARLSRLQQDVVLCWRLDCFPATLSSFEEMTELISIFAHKNISFVSIEDHLDTDLQASEFILSFHKAWQNFKKNRKITNAKASLQKAKSRNTIMNSGRKKIRNDEQIRELRKAGFSIREIAKKIQLSTTAVQRALKADLPARSLKDAVKSKLMDL